MAYRNEQRPVLDIPWTLTDRLVLTTGAVALVATILLPAFAWSGLPDDVPVHFGVSGDPDRWSSRWMVWLLPLISIATCVPMALLTRVPHVYNYPWRITAENARDVYRTTRSMMIWLTAEIALLFAYIEWVMLRTATDDAGGLSVFFVPAVIVAIFATMGYFFYTGSRAARQASR